MDKKKIAYITGTRADFGRVIYTLKEIEKKQDTSIEIIATNMHLEKEYGYTIKEIEKYFNVKERVKSIINDDSRKSMVETFGKEIIGISRSINRIKPDLILVLGDRGEMLAGSIVGKHYGMPVGHIGGGHISGSIDNKIRDAITIFSDLHFVANKVGKNRVIKLGADPDNVFIVGAPDLESIVKKDFTKKEEIKKKYQIDKSKHLVLFSLHPVVDKKRENEKEMKIVCDCLDKQEDLQIIATYPNADSGGRKMADVLRKYSSFEKYKHIDYKDYLGLMNIASVIVGNSSAGIIEAPSFKIPTVNIGDRQNMRQRAENVIDVKFDKKEINKAITKALYDKEFAKKIEKTKNPYGDGLTSKHIVDVIGKYL